MIDQLSILCVNKQSGGHAGLTKKASHSHPWINFSLDEEEQCPRKKKVYIRGWIALRGDFPPPRNRP